MLFDWNTIAFPASVQDLQLSAPLTLSGEGLWVCLVSSGQCSASVPAAGPLPLGAALILPPQSVPAGHLILSRAPLALVPGKTVEKWTALIPAASSGETSRYGVLLVYRKKAVGAYLLERPSGVVVGLKDMQAAMAEAEAKQTSGEDYEGDWGERHDEELTGSEPAQQTSGEDYSGDWGERHDEELTAQQTSGEPDAVPQAVPYTELPLDAEGYPVE